MQARAMCFGWPLAVIHPLTASGNPQTGGTITIPSRTLLTFKASNVLKTKIIQAHKLSRGKG